MPKLIFCVDAAPDSEVYETISSELPECRIRLFSSATAMLDRLTNQAADAVLIHQGDSEIDWQDIVSRVRTADSRVLVVACAPENSDAALLECVDQVIRGELSAAKIRRALEPAARNTTVAPNCGMIGTSDAVQQALGTIRRVAPRRSTVLITGETGTGKEVAARAIHQLSANSKGRFVAVNCSAIPAPLLEAELFGHVRGAFTGAVQNRVGRFEEARNGTIFLDEVGDLPLDLQAKLLRVLQEHEFQRLGSSETVAMEARIIAATNVNLAHKIREGLFREDLFYRLNVVALPLPPLRARVQDIPALANHFAQRICRAEALRPKTLDYDALEMLMTYAWPGNIRQLENAIETAVVLSDDRAVLTAADFRLPFEPVDSFASGLPEHGLDYEQTVSAFETRILREALTRTSGNKKMAAQLLGLKRTTLTAKVRSLQTATGCVLM